MLRVGLTEFRKHFYEYLRRVKAGETIILTERGKEIVLITPIREKAEEGTKPATAGG